MIPRVSRPLCNTDPRFCRMFLKLDHLTNFDVGLSQPRLHVPFEITKEHFRTWMQQFVQPFFTTSAAFIIFAVRESSFTVCSTAPPSLSQPLPRAHFQPLSIEQCIWGDLCLHVSFVCSGVARPSAPSQALRNLPSSIRVQDCVSDIGSQVVMFNKLSLLVAASSRKRKRYRLTFRLKTKGRKHTKTEGTTLELKVENHCLTCRTACRPDLGSKLANTSVVRVLRMSRGLTWTQHGRS